MYRVIDAYNTERMAWHRKKIMIPKIPKRGSEKNTLTFKHTSFGSFFFLFTFANSHTHTPLVSFIVNLLTRKIDSTCVWECFSCMMTLQLLFLKDSLQHFCFTHFFSSTTLIQLEYFTNFTLVYIVLYLSTFFQLIYGILFRIVSVCSNK